MACSSITAFTKQCGETLRAGTQSVYMIAYSDLVNIAGSTKPYASTAGVVSEISLVAGKKFVKVELAAKSEGVTENHTVSETGIITSTAGFTGSITGFSKEGGEFVKSVLGQDVVVLAQLGSGKFIVIGLDAGFKLTESVGTNNATDSNRALTFAGDVYDYVPEVDETIIASLI